MGRPRDPELWQMWRERLARQRTSGLSVAEFCRQEKISDASYYAWRNRLSAGTEAIGRRGGREHRYSNARRQIATDSAVRFVQLPLTSLPQPADVEVALTDGTLIRVPGHAGEALERVLRVLLSRASLASQEAHP